MLAKLAMLALVLACASPRAVLAQEAPSEPPPEAGDGDYTFERADSSAGAETGLPKGSRADSSGDSQIETRFGARGAGGAPLQSRSVSFRGDGAEGSFREGDDTLAGGRFRTALASGTLAWGKLAPRWGRGLLLGAPIDPWRGEAADRGANAGFRGRAGEGVLFSRASSRAAATGGELLAGRFAKRTLLGARLWRRDLSAGVLAGDRIVAAPGAPAPANAAASAALTQAASACEVALDSRGRWRAEAALRERLGAARLALRARGGHAAYRSLAEGARSGPARLLAAGLGVLERERPSSATAADADEASASSDTSPEASPDPGSSTGVRAEGALWSFGPGADGARAALEVRRALRHHGAASLGFEEQHGPRRAPSALSRPTPAGMRQGIRAEWSAVARGRTFTLRHELWGERAFARLEVRRLLEATVQWPLAAGARLTVRHAVWRAMRSERLYLPEEDVDRVTLRAVTGAGARTRLQAALPALGGRVSASLVWTDPSPPRATPGWSVEWTRRVRR